MMFNPLQVARRLRQIGLVGINQRNADYVLRYNQRKYYPRVDDKLLTKKLAIEHGLPVPELYAVVAEEHEIEEVHAKLQNRDSFVVKPAHGSGGDGILVISGRRGSKYRRSSGNLMSAEDFNHHISNALSGLFSLGGQPDKVLIEYCVQFDPIFDHVSYRGVPDVRIIVFQGYPVMAMIRLPTRQSDGKANLHQGAIGVGIDIPTGKTCRGVWGNEPVKEHPDTEHSIIGMEIPHWDDLLLIAANASAMSGLGYVGVDIVLDRSRGPMIL
ncbi:MAG: alpha-L-glutamate ligase-like protein, partial [Xanthomonadales bacterium]|nr:alpha-L-glutamate ligase-like protein [Xanthomonadales bacterium]